MKRDDVVVVGHSISGLCLPVPATDGTGPFGPWESGREDFYHDCPEKRARRLFQQLRHQAFRVFLSRVR